MRGTDLRGLESRVRELEAPADPSIRLVWRETGATGPEALTRAEAERTSSRAESVFIVGWDDHP